MAREDALGARTAFSYDTQGRLRKLTLPDGTRHGVNYDAAGRVHQVQRDGLGTLDYTYVKGGKQPETMTLTDKKGQRVRQVHWLYDAMGRVVQRTHEAPGVSADTYTFRYDGKLADGTLVPGQRGRLSQVRGPGYRKTFRYDAAGLLSQQETAFDGWQTIVQDFTYFLDERVKRSHTRILAADGSLRQTQLLDYQLDSQARLQGTTRNGRPLYGVEYDALNRPAHVSLDAGAFAATLSYDPVTSAADSTGPGPSATARPTPALPMRSTTSAGGSMPTWAGYAWASATTAPRSGVSPLPTRCCQAPLKVDPLTTLKLTPKEPGHGR